MNGLCRLCASLKKPDLLTSIADQSADDVCQKLSACLNININVQSNDSLPKSVCQECMENLNVSYKFYTKVQEAQETLLTFFPSAQQQTENQRIPKEMMSGQEQDDILPDSYNIKREVDENAITPDGHYIDDIPTQSFLSTFDTSAFRISNIASNSSNLDEKTCDGYLIKEGSMFSDTMEDNTFDADYMPKVRVENDKGQVFGISHINEFLHDLDDLEYKIIIREYKSRTSFLENSDRTKLAKIIIKHILQKDVNIELHSKDYLLLADMIGEIMPLEPRDLYYSPAKFGKKASGKLYDAYNNLRKRLSQAGFLKRRSYIPKTTGNTIQQEASVELIFLKNTSCINEEYMSNWQKCLPERQNILQKTKFSEFLKQFPIFNTDNMAIFQLMKSDVSTLHPTNTGIAPWDDMYEKVYQKMEKNNDNIVQNILKSWESASKDCRKALAFLLLPRLFPAAIVKKAQKKITKIAKIEVQEIFIAHFESLQDANNFEEHFLEDRSTLRPKIVFFGEYTNLKAYVMLCDKKYFFDDPLQAIENCFYLYIALNIRYPAETKSVWNFLQIYVFGITTQHDLNNTSIKTVYYNLIN